MDSSLGEVLDLATTSSTIVCFMKLTHVLLHVEVPAEPFATYCTLKWLLVIVCVHMEGKVIDLVKGFITYMALVDYAQR